MIPPQLFASLIVGRTASLMVELERRATELRALSVMTEAEAYQWLTILSGIQATSPRETPDSAWEFFRFAIMEGGSPIQAAAALVERMRRRDKGL